MLNYNFLIWIYIDFYLWYQKTYVFDIRAEIIQNASYILPN